MTEDKGRGWRSIAEAPHDRPILTLSHYERGGEVVWHDVAVMQWDEEHFRQGRGGWRWPGLDAWMHEFDAEECITGPRYFMELDDLPTPPPGEEP